MIKASILAALLTVATLGCRTGGASRSGVPTVAAPAAPATQPEPRSVTAANASDITPQLIARGDSIFHKASCAVCHGSDAKGTPHAPDLVSGAFAQIDGSYEQIVRLITTGVPENKISDPSFPDPMPPRGGENPPLTDEQIRALAAYVYSLSHH